MKQEDYKKLEVERAKFAVSIDSARALVAGWTDNVPEEDDRDIPVPVLMASGRGLGSADKSAAPSKPNEAYERLKKETWKADNKRKAQNIEKKDLSSDEEPVKGSTRVRAASALDLYRSSKKKKK